MTIVPNDDFDLIEYLIKEISDTRNLVGFKCDLEIEIGTAWIDILNDKYGSWCPPYSDESTTILGMPLRITHDKPYEIRVWASRRK